MFMKLHFNNILIKIFILIFVSFLGGCEKNEIVSVQLQFKDYTSDFDSVWTNYDKKYPLFTYKKIDWNDIYIKYHNKFDNITLEERNNLLVNMLSVLKDEHIVLHTPDDTYIPTYINTSYQRNFNKEYITKFITSLNWHNENKNWGWGESNNIGYIRFLNFYIGNIDIVNFDKALDSLSTTSGIIIDIRKNSGGNLMLIESIWNRFTNLNLEVGYLLYRNGPSHDDYAPKNFVITNPRGEWQYLKPVILLIGRFCGSVGEILAETLSHFDNVTLIGDTTKGSVEATSDFYLSDGLQYPVPIVAYFNILNKPLEWNGVSPDIYFDPSETKNDTVKDVIIEEAIRKITQNAHNLLNPPQTDK